MKIHFITSYVPNSKFKTTSRKRLNFGACTNCSFLNLGIDFLALMFHLPYCVTIVAKYCVCLIPFCVHKFASKLLETCCISLPYCFGFLLLSLFVDAAAAYILNLRTSSYDVVTPYSYNC